MASSAKVNLGLSATANLVTSLSSVRLLRLVVMLIAGTAMIQASPVREPRWMRPCAGNEPMELQTRGATHRAKRQATEGSCNLDSIKGSAQLLQNLVASLKQKYITRKLFVNENEAQVISSHYSGPQLQNLISSVRTATETDLVLIAAYDSLSRFSLFVDLAKRGEENAQNQRHSMEEDYNKIENDPSGGLYTLLCHIKCFMMQRGVSLSTAAEDQIRALSITGSSNRNSHSAVRHAEDYVTLHALQQLLTDLVAGVTRLQQPA